MPPQGPQGPQPHPILHPIIPFVCRYCGKPDAMSIEYQKKLAMTTSMRIITSEQCAIISPFGGFARLMVICDDCDEAMAMVLSQVRASLANAKGQMAAADAKISPATNPN